MTSTSVRIASVNYVRKPPKIQSHNINKIKNETPLLFYIKSLCT